MFDGQLCFHNSTEELIRRGTSNLAADCKISIQLTSLLMKSLVWKNGLDVPAPFVVVVPAAMMDGDGFRMRCQEISEDGSRQGSLYLVTSQNRGE
jgi:hypothetical protein